MAYEYSALLDIRIPEPEASEADLLADLLEDLNSHFRVEVSTRTTTSIGVDGEVSQSPPRTRGKLKWAVSHQASLKQLKGLRNLTSSRKIHEAENKEKAAPQFKTLGPSATSLRRPQPTPQSAPQDVYTYDGGASFARARPKNEWDMIRVFDLAPGDYSAPIHCTLRLVYIPHEPYYGLSRYCPPHPGGEAPRYEALSYTWGDSTARKKILVNGKHMDVGQNLYTALRYIRKSDVARTLWVDAICIDQGNEAERNVQVFRMAQIYRNASCVLIWLGEALLYHDLAVDALEAMGGAKGEMVLEPLSSTYDTGECEVLRPRDPRALRHPLSLSMDERLGVFMGLFVLRKWWSRMWVVQEVTLPPKAYVLCGTSVLEWDTIDNMFRLNESFRRMMESGLQPELADALRSAHSLCNLRYHAQFAENTGFTRPHTTLQSLIAANALRQSSDPRDMIYALLGLSSCPKAMVVDYSKPVRAVYIEAARVIIADLSNDSKTKQPSLNIIATVYRSVDESKFDLPSWVPDWSMKQDIWSPINPYYELNTFQTMRDGPKLDQEPEINDLGILIFLGIKFDTICLVSPKLEGKMGEHWEHTLWEPLGLDSIRYPTGESGIDAFWRTMLTDEGDKLNVRLLPTEMDIYRQEFLIWSGRRPRLLRGRLGLKNWSWGPRLLSLPHRKADWSKESGVFDKLHDKLRGYVFAVTTKGYWGLVPERTRVGDIISIARSVNVPLILTSLDSLVQSSELYNLRGAAYIHGIMDGELVYALVKGDLVEEQIRVA